MRHSLISLDMPSLRLPYWITRKKEEMLMNLKVLRWLMTHMEVLTKVLEIAKKWDPASSMVVRWGVVDEIARIVLPVIEKELGGVSALSVDEATYQWEGFDDEEAVEVFSLGAQAGAMGIDWKTLVEVIIPIVMALLDALNKAR